MQVHLYGYDPIQQANAQSTGIAIATLLGSAQTASQVIQLVRQWDYPQNKFTGLVWTIDGNIATQYEVEQMFHTNSPELQLN